MRLRGAELRSLIRLAFSRDPFRSERGDAARHSHRLQVRLSAPEACKVPRSILRARLGSSGRLDLFWKKAVHRFEADEQLWRMAWPPNAKEEAAAHPRPQHRRPPARPKALQGTAELLTDRGSEYCGNPVLDRNVGGLRAFENFIYDVARTPKHIRRECP